MVGDPFPVRLALADGSFTGDLFVSVIQAVVAVFEGLLCGEALADQYEEQNEPGCPGLLYYYHYCFYIKSDDDNDILLIVLITELSRSKPNCHNQDNNLSTVQK